MKVLLLFLMTFVSCSSSFKKTSKPYVLMNSLWKKSASKEEVVETLGSEYKNIEGGIRYYYPEIPDSVKSAHFFESDKLVEQFIFLDETSLSDFLVQIPCSWEKNAKRKNHGHTFYIVKEGRCVKDNITYQYLPGNGHYEVRWKK